MSGYGEAVDFALLDGAGPVCSGTKRGKRGYDARFVDWVMVHRGLSKKDAVHKANRLGKVQREYGTISTPQDAERVAALIMASDYESSTKRHKLFVVEDWCTFLGFTVHFRKPKADRRCPNYLTQTQLSTLIHAVRDYREYALVAVFVFTGARLGEVVRLNIGDVSFQTHTVLLRNTKSGRDRTVPMAPGLEAVIREYLSRKSASGLTSDTPLFNSCRNRRLSGRRIQDIVRDIAIRAGLPQIHVHMLRHSFASAWVANGGDLFHLQQVLGHGNIATTMVYLHTDHQTLRRVYEASMPRL